MTGTLAMWLVLAITGVAAGRAQDGVSAAGITKVSGVDGATGTEYVLLATEGKVQGGGAARLVAQCAKTKGGKFTFEWMADEPSGLSAGAGAQLVEALAFQGPWGPSKDELFPPRLEKVQVAMEFVGYVKAKPMKRQWEYPRGTTGLIRYATPGMSSANMEDVAYFMRYLRSLPTLRLTVPGRGVEEFETTSWQAAVKAEALCKASGS